MSRAASFVAFARSLAVALTPGQECIARVAFDGEQPAKLPARLRELAREIFGSVDVVPGEARGTFVAICGARGGKSRVLLGLRALHAMLTADVSSCAPGEQATAVLVAPDLRLARIALRFARGAVEASPQLRKLVVSESRDGFVLRRPDGPLVALEVLPATKGGSALRGRTLVFAGFDESCFFRDEQTGVVNDADLYAAVAPRLIPGAQCVFASTPWARAGLTWELFEHNRGAPTEALVAHAPTWCLRSDEQIRRMLDRERERDIDNYRREFGAEFLEAGAAEFFDRSLLAAAADVTMPSGPSGCSGALDAAFRTNSATATITRSVGNHVEVVETLELKPEKGKPLRPSEVCATFAALAKRHGVTELVADAHYIESVREHLAEHKVRVVEAPGGQSGKLEVHLAVRDLLREGRLRIDASERRLLRQLGDIVGRPVAGGGLSLSSPVRNGAHGDLASSAILACWAASSVVVYTPEQIERQRTVNARLTSMSRWGGQRFRGFG